MKERMPAPQETADKTVEELRDALLATGKVEKFIDPKPLEQLGEDMQLSAHVGEQLAGIENQLRKPLVVETQDAFDTQDARNKWQEGLPLGQRLVYLKSGLRAESISSALQNADKLIGQLSNHEVGAFEERQEALATEYEKGWGTAETPGTFSQDERVAFVIEKLNPYISNLREAILDANT